MKYINIFSIAFLIVFSSGFLSAGQLSDELQETYLKGNREEKNNNAVKRWRPH